MYINLLCFIFDFIPARLLGYMYTIGYIEYVFGFWLRFGLLIYMFMDIARNCHV